MTKTQVVQRFKELYGPASRDFGNRQNLLQSLYADDIITKDQLRFWNNDRPEEWIGVAYSTSNNLPPDWWDLESEQC